MAQSSQVECDGRLVGGTELATTLREDAEYYLVSYQCNRCSRTHYRVVRFCGAFHTAFLPPDDDFSPDAFEDYVDKLDRTMSIDIRLVLDEVYDLIAEVNSPLGITSDGSYIETLRAYARERYRELLRTGHLRELWNGADDKGERNAVHLAFELGFAASELRMRDDYEEALFEGWRLQEGREAGREAARRAKVRRTRRVRSAIRKAVLKLYGERPDLTRNDAATARAVESLQLPELGQRTGRSIGREAIVKHIRALRSDGELRESA